MSSSSSLRPGRLQWTDVPDALRGELGAVLSAPVTDTHTPGGGFGHQLAAVLTASNGRAAFAKAAPTPDPLTSSNLREAAVLRALPADAPAPALLAVCEAADWTAVVMECLDGSHPDLSPDGADSADVAALLDKLVSAPAPAAFTAVVGAAGSSSTAGLHGWVELAEHPDQLSAEIRETLPRLVELEQRWPQIAGRGDRIVHGDLRADNMVRDRRRGPVFVDWAHAALGPACVDAVSLAPQFVLAGHDPRRVARLLREHPAAHEVEASAAFLAALTGHWQRNSLLAAPPAAPGLRGYQRAAARAGLAVLDHLSLA